MSIACMPMRASCCLCPQNHNQCVTEHEKFALGATKPGGFAANGVSQQTSNAKPNEAGEPSGLEFLSTRPPWKCSVCNVSCTSKETLMSHASGVKHKRRARAALAAQNGGNKQQPASQPEQPAQTEPETAKAENGQAEQDQAKDKSASKPSEAPANGTKAAAANGSSKKRTAAADSSSSSDSDSSSSSDSEDETPAKKKAKVHPALQDEDKVAKLIKAASKKMSKKGKLGPKKIQALATKKLGVKEADEALLTAIKEQVRLLGLPF